MMELHTLKEIRLYHKLFSLVIQNKNKHYSKSDIGYELDGKKGKGKYPNPGTNNFIKKMILFKVLAESHKDEYKGKVMQLYKIDKNKLVEIVRQTREYEMFKEFFKDETFLRVAKRT